MFLYAVERQRGLAKSLFWIVKLKKEGNFWSMGTYAPYMGKKLVIQQKVENS